VETKASLQGVIDSTLGLVRSALHAGLTAAQAQWAERVYREHVLPMRLADTPDPDLVVTRRRVLSAANDIVRAIGGLSPEEKLRVLTHLEWAGRLSPLSTKALGLALARAANPENAVPRAEAISVLDSLNEFAREVEEKYPGNASLRTELSEALLDAAYAAEPSEFMSFRLARLGGFRDRPGGDAELLTD
jgi:hypothetical protein